MWRQSWLCVREKLKPKAFEATNTSMCDDHDQKHNVIMIILKSLML